MGGQLSNTTELGSYRGLLINCFLKLVRYKTLDIYQQMLKGL